ncbi:rabphilin-3A isoform X2 [Neocloeon triangulifer]|uniref:rabphilin-3A isoform X2 n=1 Tax=Neocloeon triangulifer TaxID=2078957 RepID=UPI00286F0291|nr:rabphilin-3A isoform X2 [Neocloeon triangulifer]
MVDLSNGRDSWTCPNDRQLALRAKLQTGWSVKTQSLHTLTKKPEALNEQEKQTILDVIKRAETLEKTEQQRIGRLVHHVESMKKNALGDGSNKCVLCGDTFGFLGPTASLCKDCKKAACQKCGVEEGAAASGLRFPASGSSNWLCKICAETREMWKKSGAWFFKGMPKYELPEPGSLNGRISKFFRPAPSPLQRVSIAEDCESSSEEEPPVQPPQPPQPSPVVRHAPLSHVHSISSVNTSHISRRESSLSHQWASEEGSSSVTSSDRAGSVFSEVEDDVIIDEVYLGSMQFSVTFDPQTSTLHCCLIRAKGLRGMDVNGLCDSYCRAQLLPSTSGKAITPLRTKTVHKTRDPEFNETLAWFHVTPADHIRKTLHIVIYDEDKYGDEALGSARLHLARLTPGKTSRFNVFLEKPYPDEVCADEGPGRGRILIALNYVTKRKAITVGIIRCAGLLAMDSNGTSDPFVKIQLKDDPHRRKFKTAIKWRNLNPEFCEHFTFEIKMGELSSKTLMFSVWDKDLGKSDDYLGGLELGFTSKGDRLRHWLDTIKFPDRRHERWHNLCGQIIGD